MYRTAVWLKVKRLREEGLGYREIGRMLNLDRRTAKKLCRMEEQPKARLRKRGSVMDEFGRVVELWLSEDPRLRATLIYTRLAALGYRGSYPTVRRYVRRKKQELVREAYVRFETLPGRQAQVDFSEVQVKYGGGRREKLFLFVCVLGFSRYKSAEVSDYCRRKALMYLLEKAFWDIGGVVGEVLFDNLRPVATRPRRFGEEGEIADEWRRFEAYYGFTTRLSMIRRAQTKGKVEKAIDPVKAFIQSNVFLSRDHLSRELKEYMERENGTVHESTNQKPVERIKIEREFFLSLPLKPYDLARIEKRKVSKDCLVSVGGVRYSVPWEYVGQRVEVRMTSAEVQVFSLKGALLASHRRLSDEERKRYRFVVTEEHYRGLSGVREAFKDLRKLNEMECGPFLVEERSLSEYEEALSGC